MAIIRYHCNHCNHAFEAEQKENLECPACFWTSSVIPESDHREIEMQSQTSASQKKGFALPTGLRIALEALKPLFLLLIIAGGIGAGFLYLKPKLKGLPNSLKSEGVKIKISGQEAFSKKGAQKKQGKPAQEDKEAGTQMPSAQLALTEQEKAVLARKIELDPARELSPLEKEMLSRQAVLKTGRVEKLPGPVWNLEQFKKMLTDQQAAYQVPLPRSYRNKLQALFEAKYLTGAQAFTEGRLLEARNLWVESLGFPIFANDIEKHRGVVLTMLRPFINDTLSKIGAMNAMLVEGPVRDRESRLNQAYEQFQALLAARNWRGAYSAAQSLLDLTDDFDKTAVQTPQVPPYPPSAQMDRDIGKALYDLLEASRPATADVGSLERDVRMKLQVIETLLPDQFATEVGLYQAGLKEMDAAHWQVAMDQLAQIKQPAVLQRDSSEKIKILQKLARAELESAGVSG